MASSYDVGDLRAGDAAGIVEAGQCRVPRYLPDAGPVQGQRRVGDRAGQLGVLQSGRESACTVGAEVPVEFLAVGS